MSELLDLLLRPDVVDVRKHLPTARYKLKRLSQAAGEDVVFTLRALPYGRTRQVKESMAEDVDVMIVLEGVVAPDLREGRLLEKFGAVTPAELVKALLLPGEIDDISLAVERLSGYRQATLEEVKNG